jgi:hypothetical protein
MRAHGQATAWGTHVEVGRIGGHAGWYPQLKAWWAARKATRRQAQLAQLDACWDAQHEAVRPLRAEAAPEMAAAQGALTVATMLYGLQQ